MNLKLARQRVADLKGAIAQAKKDKAAIPNAALTEKRPMTEEERTKFLAFGPQIEKLEAEFAEAEEVLAAAEAANEANRNYRLPEDVRIVPDGTPTPAAEATSVIVGADRTTRAPGYFGRQLLAVRAAAMASKGGDPLTTAELQLLKPMRAAATGANTDVPSEGGFLVSQQMSNDVLQRAYASGAILSRVNRMPIGPGFNGAKLPAIDETSRADNSRFGGIISGWLGQGNTLTSGKPKFREIDLKLRKVAAFVYSTDEMNVDSVLFEAWVNRNLPLELQFRVENAILNGDGSTQPLGVLNSPALISVTRNTAAHVIAEDLRAMYARSWSPVRSNSVFFVDQSVEPEFDTFSVPVGTGGELDPSFKAAGSVPGQQYATYKGIPIIPVEHCAALGTAGDIVLVNLGEYVLIDKGGVDSAVSLHVAFLTDEAVYRFIYRVDGTLTWNSALTPKSAGDTLSCALALTT